MSTLTARLDRTDSNTSWGFRMAGGKDFGTPLQIQRVTPGSLAAKCGVQTGDYLLNICENATDGMRHKEAQQVIILAGNSLVLKLQRGGGGMPVAAPAPPQPSQYSSQAYVPQSNGTGPTATPGTAAAYPRTNPHQPNLNPNEYQNFNNAPTPWQGVAPNLPNHQYNPYVQNITSATNSFGAMNIGGQPSGPAPIPPWQSGPGADYSAPKPAAAPYQPPARSAPAPAPAAVPAQTHAAPSASKSAWQPRIPTGPRKMRVMKAGEAKSMPSGGNLGGRIPCCSNCHMQIRGPFVLALDKSWCPDHFVCSNPNCLAPLVDTGFVEEDGQLFCERDYQQYFAPRCHKCGQAIMGDCVNALKETFHPQCFTCTHCNQSIGTGSFHIEEGKTYCEKDWQAMFQTKCYGCQFPIEPGDRWVEALNENWHSECFNCSTCQINLEGQQFFAKAGKPFCKKHAMGR